MTLTVTALTAVFCALLLIFLAFKTVQQRIKTETVFGSGDSDEMKMVRGAHANLAEHAPLAIIMIALLELANAHHYGLTAVASLFLLSRTLHAYGMFASLKGVLKPRQSGVIGTWLSYFILAGWILYIFVTKNL